VGKLGSDATDCTLRIAVSCVGREQTHAVNGVLDASVAITECTKQNQDESF
jgi:hypothetical protein